MVSSGHRPILALVSVLAVAAAALVLFWAASDTRPAQAIDNFDISFNIKNCNALPPSFIPGNGVSGIDTTGPYGVGGADGIADCLQDPAKEAPGLAANTVTDITTTLCLPGRTNFVDCPASSYAPALGAKNFSEVVNFIPNGYQINGRMANDGFGADVPYGALAGAGDNTVNLTAALNSIDCNGTFPVPFLFYNVALPNVGTPGAPSAFGNPDPRTATNIAWPRDEGKSNRFGGWDVGTGTTHPGGIPDDPPDVGVVDSVAPFDVAEPSSIPITANYPKFLLDLFDPDYIPGVGDNADIATDANNLPPVVPIAVYGGLSIPTGASSDWVPLYFVQFAPGQLANGAGLWVAPHSYARMGTGEGAPNFAILNDPTAVKSSVSTILDFCGMVLSKIMLLGNAGGVDRFKTPNSSFIWKDIFQNQTGSGDRWTDVFTNKTGTTVNDLHLTFPTGKRILSVLSITGGTGPDTWDWQIDTHGLNTSAADCATHAADEVVDITGTGGTTVPTGGVLTVVVQTCAMQTSLSATAQWTLGGVNTGSAFTVVNQNVNDLHLVFDPGKRIKRVWEIEGGAFPDTWNWKIGANPVNTPSSCSAGDDTVDYTATGGTGVPNGTSIRVLVETCAAETSLSVTAQWTASGVNKGSTFVVVNTRAYTYFYQNWVMSLRDADNDGRENGFDTCPYTVDGPPWDSDVPTHDGLYDSCDTIALGTLGPAVTDPGDIDGDGFDNRGDNCPRVKNGLAPVDPGDNGQADSELGVVSYGAAAPDGGPKTDSIGDLCDTVPLVANGNFQVRAITTAKCIGGVDADRDGYCVADQDVGSDAASNCSDNLDNDGDTKVNDGCPAAGPPEAGTNCANALDDDGDGIINDGCPAVAARELGDNQVKHVAWAAPLIGTASGDIDADTLGVKSDWQETFMGTDAADRCANTVGPNNDPLPDAWPFDFNDDRSAGLADVLSYIPYYLTVGNPRWDQNQDGSVGLADILAFIPVYLSSCVP